MSKYESRRRRGTAIAAAALSLALVTPTIQSVSGTMPAAFAATAHQPTPKVDPIYPIYIYNFPNGLIWNDSGKDELGRQFKPTVGSKPLAGDRPFSLDPTKLPEFWEGDGKRFKASWDTRAISGNIGINERSGLITFSPRSTETRDKADLKGTSAIIPVDVKYADGTTGTVEAKILLIDDSDDLYRISYPTKRTVKPGETLKVKPRVTLFDGTVIEPDELNNEALIRFPDGSIGVPTANEGFKFSVAGNRPAGYTVDINSKTGEVKISQIPGARVETQFPLRVRAALPRDGRTTTAEVEDETIDSTQIVLEGSTAFSYPEKSVKPGETVTIDPVIRDKDGKVVPNTVNAAFKLGENPPPNSSVTADGKITVTAPATAKPGDRIFVPVEVNYSEDGLDKIALVEAIVDVIGADQAPNTSVDVSGVKEIEPTGEQDTGIVVANQSPDTKIAAKDEDGQDLKIEIADDGGLTVTPDEDPNGNPVKADGPITVVITDPNLPGGKVEVTVPVKGHTEGTDDNAVTETSVVVPDGGNPSVTEGQGSQDTGVSVTFPVGKEPTVTAIDEDGNSVAVEIGPDGKLMVDPDSVTDADGNPVKVDGPITVVITDSEGKTHEVTVDVVGADGDKHAAGVDNNDDGKPAAPVTETSVVVPDGHTPSVVEGLGSQDTGVSVTFPVGEEPTVTATDEDGNSVAVEIGPDGKLMVNPDAVTDGSGNSVKVDGPITVVITDSEGKTHEVTVDVVGADGDKHTAGVDNNGDGKPGDSIPGGTGGLSPQCRSSLLGHGIPLMLLIPLGIAAMSAVPGIQQQVQQINTELQRQIGVFNPGLAAAAADFDARVKGAGVNLTQVILGLAMLSYGITATSIIGTQCAPDISSGSSQ